MEGMGSVALWGASRALDLLLVADSSEESMKSLLEEQNVHNAIARQRAVPIQDGQQKDINILLLGAADIRHILKTISRRQRHPSVQRIKFYILDSQTTVLARHLLLLSTLLDQPEEVSVIERAQLFLELYGNGLLREKTATFVSERANKLIRIVTDQTGSLSKMIRFDKLKYRERDDLESVLKFWQHNRSIVKPFDIVKLWDYRVRRLLGNRYDSRENVIDWDYNMKLREKTSLVSVTEYLRWRLHSIAFEVRASPYIQPNRTLASVEGIKQQGVTVSKWGYFGDIYNSPYLAFGIDCEDKDMLKKQNDIPKHNAQDISERNVIAMVYELLTGVPYVADSEVVDQPLLSPEAIADHLTAFEVHLLPCDPNILFSTKRQQFLNFFDIAYIGTSYSHRLADIGPLLASDGSVILETAYFLLDLTNKQSTQFLVKVHEMARKAHLTLDNVFASKPSTDGQTPNEKLDIVIYRKTRNEE